MSKDFEHYAKQKGDDFKLQPRENVWERIEGALDEKNRRRVAWWWWGAPLLLLVGTGIGYVFFSGSNDKGIPAMADTVGKVEQPAAPKPENTPSTSEAVAEAASPISEETTPDNAESHTTNTTTQAKNQLAKTSADGGKNKATASTSNNTGHPTVSTGGTVAGNSKVSSSSTRSLTFESPEDQATANKTGQTAADPVPKSQLPIPNNEVPAAIVSSTQPGAIVEDEPGRATTTKDPDVINAEKKMDSAVSVARNKKSGVDPTTKNKTAKWYIQVGAGIAGMHQTAFGTADKDYVFDPSQLNSGGNSTNPLMGGKPKYDDPGLSISLAVQSRQDIGKRLQWVAGIGWQYQQVKQYRGAKVDSAINFSNSVVNFTNSYYYQSGSTKSEKGINHRLFVTNDLSWQLLKNKSWLRLNVGLYTGFNIHNDYYVKDNAQRLVKNDAVYSNWFIGISPAVEMVIKKKWTIGLHTHIDFTKAYKELDNAPRHWSGWEIKAGIPIFNK